MMSSQGPTPGWVTANACCARGVACVTGRPPATSDLLVGGLVLPHVLGADPAPLGDRQPRLPGPRPHGTAIHPLRTRTAPTRPPATAADQPTSRDERGKRGGQPGPVQ